MEDNIKKFLKDYNNNNSYKVIRDKFDVTLLVLYKIFQENGFKILKEDGTELEDGKLAPDNWNTNNDSYTFVLRHDRDSKKNTFVIKALRMGNVLLVNAMIKGDDSKIFTLDIDTNKLVNNDNFSNVDELLKNLKDLAQVIELNLIKPLVPEIVVQSSTNNNNNNNNTQPPRNNPPQQPPHREPLMVGEPRYGNPFFSHRNQGDPDLYPVGLPQFRNVHQPYFVNPYQGGSNYGPDHPIFGGVHNPYGSGSGGGDEFYLPQGSVPPGARFDPFGPPGAGPNSRPPNRGNPDRDDFQPPKFDPPGFI